MEICAVPIDWKMLTTLRPKLKVDEDYFDRLIEMGKLQIKTEVADKKINAPQNTQRKFKNKVRFIATLNKNEHQVVNSFSSLPFPSFFPFSTPPRFSQIPQFF